LAGRDQPRLMSSTSPLFVRCSHSVPQYRRLQGVFDALGVPRKWLCPFHTHLLSLLKARTSGAGSIFHSTGRSHCILLQYCLQPGSERSCRPYASNHFFRTTDQLYVEACSCARRAICKASSGSRSSRITPSAIARESPNGQRSAVSSCFTMYVMPPAVVVTTGTPEAMASRIESGALSTNDALTKMSARSYHSDIFSLGIAPQKKSRDIRSARTRASNVCRRGPSPKRYRVAWG
jgi:hypothetical protein